MADNLLTVKEPAILQPAAEPKDFVHTTIYYRKGNEVYTKSLQGYYKAAFDFKKYGLENVKHQSIILESYNSNRISAGSVYGCDEGSYLYLFKVVS